MEKLERLKSEFISIVSHELRTPLTSIKNSLDILMSGRCGEITQAADKFLSMAMRNVQRLSGIINDLLDLSKIEAGKMDFNFAPTNINTVIGYVKSALSEVAKTKGLNLITSEAENLPDITADAQRLEQVLTNLVSNAIKFTPEEGQVDITAAYGTDNFKLVVHDTGIGIDEKYHGKIFAKFVQLDSAYTKKESSTGLGLTITKELVELHGGKISLISEVNNGSTFIVEIPQG